MSHREASRASGWATPTLRRYIREKHLLLVILAGLLFSMPAQARLFGTIQVDHLGTEVAAGVSDVSFQRTFVLRNVTDRDVAVTLTTEKVPPGIEITLDRPALVVPARRTAAFSATIALDHGVLMGGKQYQAFIQVTDPDDGFQLPVTVSIASRVQVESEFLDFGTAPATGKNVWTAAATLRVANREGVADRYAMTAECCHDEDREKVSGSIRVQPPEGGILLGAWETQVVPLRIEVDVNTAMPGPYYGKLHVSSARQVPILVGFLIRKAGEPAARKELYAQDARYRALAEPEQTFEGVLEPVKVGRGTWRHVAAPWRMYQLVTSSGVEPLFMGSLTTGIRELSLDQYVGRRVRLTGKVTPGVRQVWPARLEVVLK